MKNKFILNLTILAMLFTMFTSVNAEETKIKTKTVYSTAQYGLNIRQMPNTKHERVDVVPYGTELEFVSKTNDEEWSCILYKDRLRFVHNDYISEEKPEPLPEPTPTSEPVPVESTGGSYAPSDLMVSGVIDWGGYRWTWYSQRVLPGGGLNIPGRHVDGSGYVCDGNGYICLASGSVGYGTVVNTPFGKAGKIYDFCETPGVMDVYVDW